MKKEDKIIGVKEIAKRANVSIATVDRVIHNRSGVSPKTKSKIEAIIKELNYQPNILASRLASGKVFTIAVLIPKGSEETDFWDAPLRGIRRAESEIKQYGIRIETFLFDLNDRESFTQQGKLIHEKRIDGVLLSPSFIEESIEFVKICRNRNIPFVFIDTNIKENSSLSYIGPHLFQSGYLGAKLCTFGLHDGNKVMMVNISKEINNYNYTQIEEGFKSYYKDHKKEKEIVRLDIQQSDYLSVAKRISKAFKDHPDIGVIFVPNSRVFSVARYLEEYHIKKVHLIGYDFLRGNVEYLKKGTIDFLICHKPKEQGYKGIMSLYHHLALSLPIEKIYFMPIDIITKENQEFYR
ncbi:MAG: LacI family DNA-binding transcriptional regulator [Anditalea sp.]